MKQTDKLTRRIQGVLQHFELSGKEFKHVIDAVCKVYTSDIKSRRNKREELFAEHDQLRPFVSMLFNALPPGEAQDYMTEDETEDIRYLYEIVRDYMINILTTLTGGRTAELISAIAAEMYEGRSTKSLSVAFVPLESLKIGINGFHLFFSVDSPLNESLKDFRFDDSSSGSNGQRRSIRKALELTKKDGKAGDRPQSLLVTPCEAFDHSMNLYMVGIGESKFCKQNFPTVRFIGPSSWSFSLPGDETEVFRCVAGKIIAPRPEKYKNEENKITIKKCIEQYCEQNNIDIENVLNSIEKMKTVAQEQKHGTSMVWLRKADANAEKERLCAFNRGYIANPPISADEKSAVKGITGVDGALLCNIDDGECVAYGVILDGIAVTPGKRMRGARYNSIKTYLSGERIESPPAFGIVISEDGFVDIVQKRDDKS